MQPFDDEKHFGILTFGNPENPDKYFQYPFDEGEELMLIQEEKEMWVVSKNGTRFVHINKLFPGDKMTIEVLKNADG
jgi:hypothetical protein